MGVLGNIKQFVKTSANIGVLKAAAKEGNRLGIMPSKSAMGAIESVGNAALGINDALVAAGHGSTALQNYAKKGKKGVAELERVNESSKAIASGDVMAIAGAVGGARKSYKSYKKK